MSLFNILVSNPVREDEISYSTTLKDFLKFLAVIEEKVTELEDIQQQQLFFDFKKLITDLNQCAITGSAVMEHRLGKTPQANDLDFFIEGTPENMGLIKKFFNHTQYKSFFKYFYENFLPKSKTNMSYSEGFYETVVHDEYSFIKYDVKLSTSRFSYSHSTAGGFKLNFIFITPLTRSERRLLQIEERVHGKLYIDRLIREEFFEEKGNVKLLIDSGCSTHDVLLEREIFQENNKLIENIPIGIPLHHINATFDFEELKYVYSFDVQQTISTYIAAKMLLEKFDNLLPDISEWETLTTPLSKRIKRIIKSLASRNEEFVLSTSDPETLTISSGSYTPNMLGALKRTNDNQVAWGKSLEEIFQGMQTKSSIVLTEQVIAAYHNLMIRIPKYQARGYRINDPRKIIAHTQYYMALYSSYISTNPVLNQISVKSCLLSGDKIDTIKAKIIKNWTKSLDLFRDTAEIKLKDDRDELQESTKTFEF
jgi:hypothetical protein